MKKVNLAEKRFRQIVKSGLVMRQVHFLDELLWASVFWKKKNDFKLQFRVEIKMLTHFKSS